LVVLVGS
jgi:hypothetical protein